MMKSLVILLLASLLIAGNYQARAKMLRRRNPRVLASDEHLGGEERIAANDNSKTADNEAKSDNYEGTSGSDSHRLFPEEGKPKYNPPRHV